MVLTNTFVGKSASCVEGALPHPWRHARQCRLDAHHHREDGHRSDSQASTPHLRPAHPIARPSEATTGTRSSQIHEVPNSETQRLPRYRKATNAAGRVSRPRTSRIPRESSVTPWIGAAIEAWLAARPITAFHAAGA